MELCIGDVRSLFEFAREMCDALKTLATVSTDFMDIVVLSAEFVADKDLRVHLREDSWMKLVSALRSISKDAPANYRVPDFQENVGVICGVERSIQFTKLFKSGFCDPEAEKLYRASFTFGDVEYLCVTTKEVYEQYGLPMPKGDK
ncbi:MAG: hypothetical protein ACI4T5_06040 [Prevotella sp.]